MKKARKQAKSASGGSLLSPTAMGGLVALGGFDFQTRYAACHLPLWLTEGTFHQLFFEGTGDIDIRFKEGDKSFRSHIQVKDHEVSPAELKDVLESFQQLDSALPDVYKHFTIACPSLSPTLRPIETGLARLRGATSFYDDAPAALKPTKEAIDESLRSRGLGHLIDFIHSKVTIDVGHGHLCQDEPALDLFIARLLKHPDYSGKLRAMVEPAFSQLRTAIMANKGNVLERVAIEAILRSSIGTGQAGEKSITLWVQNWTKESFDPPPDYTLDWSSHFDRASRRVPSEAVWNGELLSELNALQKRISAERKERVIRYRGKCLLSTGIALGAAFPTVGGWTFEIPQPPSPEAWKSDVAATAPYQLRIEVIDGRADGTDIVLGLNIKGDGKGDILKYIESTGNRPRLFVFVSPPSQGSQSIGGAADARAFAQAVRDELGRLLKTRQLRKTRIFFYGPFALAVFFGQHLTSVGEIQLFEYQESGYVPSCSLRT